MGGLGRVGLRRARGRRLADLDRGAQLAAGARPAWAASTRAGAWRRARKRRAARSSSRSARARRALAGKEAAVRRARLPRPRRRAACWCWRSTGAPPDGDRRQAAARLRARSPQGLTLILTPTTSLAGTTQIVARVLEVALHKAHELGFALAHIVDGAATAPLPAPSPDGVEAMGRTNDAILVRRPGAPDACAATTTRRARSRGSCRRATRATTAARSPTSSRRPATTSTRSTPRCSRRPRCGSATSTAATPGTAARSTWPLLRASVAAAGVTMTAACRASRS